MHPPPPFFVGFQGSFFQHPFPFPFPLISFLFSFAPLSPISHFPICLHQHHSFTLSTTATTHTTPNCLKQSCTFTPSSARRLHPPQLSTQLHPPSHIQKHSFSRIKSHCRKHEVLNNHPCDLAWFLLSRLWPWYLYHQELLRYRRSLCSRCRQLRDSLHHPCWHQLRTLHLLDQGRRVWRPIRQDGPRENHLLQ